ncbi:hypothetical protein CC78DRAFT_277507 [Lojkania enalia]|uniref:Uncharacterized protein n=1 Tax=Lojkania enalia TaxID=147567 RepID=A0A9P4TQ51_9PLEO|nr:hypothetical protein CC78DRAFT_277507 [Didymosphaeria enalia]
MRFIIKRSVRVGDNTQLSARVNSALVLSVSLLSSRSTASVKVKTHTCNRVTAGPILDISTGFCRSRYGTNTLEFYILITKTYCTSRA